MSEELAEIVVEEDVEVREPQAAVTLFGTDNPAVVLERATGVADALAGVIEKQKLYATISGKKHITVEGWTLLGSMLGVFPEIEWTRKTTDAKGADAWEARCVARTLAGAVVGAREAMCSRSENRWKNADDYAVRSMAQTRATSAALAAPLRFIVVLAGFAGTPEAEMPHTASQRPPAGAGDPSGTAPEDMVVHFGKNAGTPLSDLTPRQLGWYADEWGNGDSEQDIALKRAAILLKHGEVVTASEVDPSLPF